MRCQRIQPHLFDFSTGRLDARLARRVAGHLQRCAGCRELLGREKQTAALLSAGGSPGPRRDAWPALEASLHSVAIPPRSRRLRGSPLVWMGSLAAAAMLTVSLVRPLSQAPVALPESDSLRALAPRAAAGLVPERSSDPLLVLQRKLDRTLDRLADDRS